jgi:hypothetical protein
MHILRNSSVAVVRQFHGFIKKDCLEILLKSDQMIVVCPARGIIRMKIPSTWKNRLIRAGY